MPTFKTYVAVNVAFSLDGRMIPQTLRWENGQIYKIDSVLSVRPGYAAKADSPGDCYTVRIRGKQATLFFERVSGVTGPFLGRWFVERKVPVLCTEPL